MGSKYFIIDEKVLPEVFAKVVELKELLYIGKVKDISEGVKVVGISRSTYYKYKDFVFSLSESVKGQKVTIGLLLENQKGTLSGILDEIARHNGNILTINQDIPINNAANVTVTFNISDMDVEMNKLLEGINNLKNVLKVSLIAME
ncbi:ACT domain-containing protein [Clostridium sp. KNHs214]|uniref:ACT domain-containing protein n=1 Tax=Clostridium sp. KNHs214 TaxID=1540257 RepID=UPI00055785DD|nr:ACT domain-containing protein [Clostridium sp. KNHs214]